MLDPGIFLFVAYSQNCGLLFTITGFYMRVIH